MYKTKGFSLVELIIVIIIISILAAMPYFSLPTGENMDVTAEAQQFANDIRFTQSLAMSREERYRIVKSSSNSYQILNSAGTAITFSYGNNSVTLSSGITFGTWSNLPNNLIAFDGEGIPYLDTAIPGTALASGTNYNITLSNGNTTATVSVTPITGRVTVS